MNLLENTKKFEKLLDQLEYCFNEPELLCQAFMHASFVNEQPHLDLMDNERLEFLGDAVLDLAISHILMERFGHAKEGDLSKFRAMVVDESGLFRVAGPLNLGEFLFLGKGEEQCRGREKPSIIANTMEALLGAIYLDAGFEKTMEIIKKLFKPLIQTVETQELSSDFKSLLQEYTQKSHRTLPIYRLADERGPAHDKTFQVELSLNEKILATEEGKSKKEAEQRAARKAYYCLQQEAEH